MICGGMSGVDAKAEGAPAAAGGTIFGGDAAPVCASGIAVGVTTTAELEDELCPEWWWR